MKNKSHRARAGHRRKNMAARLAVLLEALEYLQSTMALCE